MDPITVVQGSILTVVDAWIERLLRIWSPLLEIITRKHRLGSHNYYNRRRVKNEWRIPWPRVSRHPLRFLILDRFIAVMLPKGRCKERFSDVRDSSWDPVWCTTAWLPLCTANPLASKSGSHELSARWTKRRTTWRWTRGIQSRGHLAESLCPVRILMRRMQR